MSCRFGDGIMIDNESPYVEGSHREASIGDPVLPDPLFVRPMWYPWQWSYLPVQPIEPSTCVGKAHVFECDHVRHCKCGAIERLVRRVPRR